MFLNSLRLRLLTAAILSIILALSIAAYGLTLIFERHVERRVDAELSVFLNQLSAHLESSPDGSLRISRPLADQRFETPLSGLYWQVVQEPSGKVTRSRSLWDEQLNLPNEPSVDDDINRHRIAGPDKSQLYVLQRRVELPARIGGGTARIAVAWNSADIQKSVRAFAGDLTPLLVVIGVLLIAAAWAQVYFGLSPLDAVRTRLTAIRTGAGQRLGSNFPTEVQPLAVEFDELLDMRNKELQRAKTRAGDLAHGLRTPLQVLQIEIERLSREGQTEAAQRLTTLAKTMRQHVERELSKARRATSMRVARAHVPTAIDQVVRVVQMTPQGQNIEWHTEICEHVHANIDIDDLSEAIGNVIENAARHARHVLSIKCHLDASDVIIEVCDDGPGIPEERQAEALSRGGRLDERGSGAGLGLAIVQDILESYNGTLSLRNNNPGLCATLRVPKSSS